MTLSRLDWTICIGYLVIVMALGVWMARGQHTNADYFIGGRRMNWFAIGMSLFASVFSSLSFVGLPREGAYEDYHLLLAIFFIPVVIAPIAAWFFVPLYQRLQVTSVYEYLERRFARSVRRFASLIFMAYSAGWMGTMLLAVARILDVVLENQSTGQTLLVISDCRDPGHVLHRGGRSEGGNLDRHDPGLCAFRRHDLPAGVAHPENRRRRRYVLFKRPGQREIRNVSP